MTLCIAAISQPPDRRILLATDGMLSLDYMSVDTYILKAMPLTHRKRWFMAFAGLPHHAQSIGRGAMERLAGKKETFGTVMEACEKAFQDELGRAIEASVLSQLGYDRQTFMREGRTHLGEADFSRVLDDVRAVRLDTQLLVGGFDGADAHLFSVCDPGHAVSHDAPGFHAIGSGSFVALGSLFATYRDWPTWLDLAYRVCEAKFRGESAPGVGKNTAMLMLESDGTAKVMQSRPIDQLREIWRALGNPPVPPEGRELIHRGLTKKVAGTPVED